MRTHKFAVCEAIALAKVIGVTDTVVIEKMKCSMEEKRRLAGIVREALEIQIVSTALLARSAGIDVPDLVLPTDMLSYNRVQEEVQEVLKHMDTVAVALTADMESVSDRKAVIEDFLNAARSITSEDVADIVFSLEAKAC